MMDAAKTLAETIRAAAESGHRLRLRGGGTKDFYGKISVYLKALGKTYTEQWEEWID